MTRRRSEGNSLDLNNLPEDNYTKDAKHVLFEDTSSFSSGSGVVGGGGYRKLLKKNGSRGGGDKEEEESGKVYECRFCSLKFFKSQALGGHMNRHRQERETETLNRARQLVFSNDSFLGQAPPLPLGQPFPYGGYHQTSGNIIDELITPPFQSIYSGGCSAAASLLQPLSLPPLSSTQPPYIYSSPPRLIPCTSQYPVNDYVIGHVLPISNTTTTTSMAPAAANHNYTCIGAPIGKPFGSDVASELVGNGISGGCTGGSFKEMPLYNNDRELGLDWLKF